MLELMAPAKLNLTLEVLARGENGFHEIRSVAQTISLCDTIRFRPGESIEFSCSDADWVASESLIARAINLLREAVVGCSRGVLIEVEKRIPLLSGLSGDSSDAAATLCGLNRLWELGLSQETLLGLAARLGSDVTFFLYGGTALLEGRGEAVTSLPPFPHNWVVLVLPPVPRMPGKTARLYSGIRAGHYSDGSITDRLVAWLNRGGGMTSPFLFNVFDEVAPDSFPGLESYRQRFLEAGAPEVHLAGSGPVLFSLVRDRAGAEAICQHLNRLGLKHYLTDTIPASEGIGTKRL
ncbi:MAG: 4-(cytidine 5'-diphospho)-2-C-methyl-D-erythritol kinase [Dehalococcoidales bacterium]|nr:4-(cytidine 5'-diphospho)-2-C-methyl-D-erythritol kinase [Dehalococcoidales bacterium]